MKEKGLAALGIRPPIPVLPILLAVMAPALAGQSGGRVHAAAMRPDSSDVLGQARQAQDRFERFRRRNLPWTWGSWGSSCDERVGRMCMRYDEGEWDMEPEPPDIRLAREQLLVDLAAAASLQPNDGWILGQRMRYMAEGDDWDEALALASSCRITEPGWCDALSGLALHGARRYVEAGLAFDAALEAMEPGEAGRWRDPSVLMQDRGDVIRDADPPGMEEQRIARTWLLSDPLFLVDGNDRLTEHYARYTMSRLRSDTHTTYGMNWGPDLEELLVRYGWEVGWERTRPGPGETRSSGVVGHHHPASVTYVPLPDAVRLPSEPEMAGWNLDPGQPRSSYAPLYAPEMAESDVQLARFWRGDSVLVVAAYRMVPPPLNPNRSTRPHSWTGPLPDETEIASGLFLVPDGGGTVLSQTMIQGPTGSLSLKAPAGSYIVSLEAWSQDDALASRARTGLRADTFAADVPALSDALLVDPEGGEPATLADAIDAAWPGTRIRVGQAVALAWEVSGVGGGPQSVAYQIRLERQDPGLSSRIVSLFGLLGGGNERTVAWSEEIRGSNRTHFRATDLGLPTLDPGRYRITLEVTLPGRSTMTTARDIEVVQ